MPEENTGRLQINFSVYSPGLIKFIKARMKQLGLTKISHYVKWLITNDKAREVNDNE